MLVIFTGYFFFSKVVFILRRWLVLRFLCEIVRGIGILGVIFYFLGFNSVEV